MDGAFVSGQSALRERAALIEELRQIVQAMKNIAFAELQRVTHLLPEQTQALKAVLDALQALPGEEDLTGAAGRGSRAPVAWLVIGAERGFCGAFNDHLASEVRTLQGQYQELRLLIAGQRLGDLLSIEPSDAIVMPGCAAIEDADAVLDQWMAALAKEAPRCKEVWLLYSGEGTMVRGRLMPFSADLGQAPLRLRAHSTDAPLHHLPLPALRAALAHQGLRLLLQGGLFASLKQEHRLRLAQMQRAQDHLEELSQSLRRRHALLRQTEITNEQETLMSSLPGENGSAARSPLAPSSP